MIINNIEKPKTQNNTTFATTLEFAEAWSKSFVNYQPSDIPTKYKFADNYQPLAISVMGSGAPRIMYAIQSFDKFGRRTISLAPSGLYASPGWENELEQSTLQKILGQLTGIITNKLTWNVRFDHKPLANGLTSLGLKFQPHSTHVLKIEQDYENIFKNYSPKIRNHVRKAKLKGVIVRDALDISDIIAFYQIYTKLAQSKEDYRYIYPAELFFNLSQCKDSVRFLVAENQGIIIAGGLFIKDGCSLMYLYGTSDRNYSHLSPGCAVIDEGIRWACESNAAYFDFGGSAGVISLEKFKSSWGAIPKQNWIFEWQNPLWQKVERIKNNVRKLVTNKN